jgi:small subunit ribosomal protein S4
VRPNDRLSIGSREKVRKLVKEAVEQRSSYPLPGWLERDSVALEGRVTVTPMRSDVSFDVREQLVVELMSK